MSEILYNFCVSFLAVLAGTRGKQQDIFLHFSMHVLCFFLKIQNITYPQMCVHLEIVGTNYNNIVMAKSGLFIYWQQWN